MADVIPLSGGTMVPFVVGLLRVVSLASSNRRHPRHRVDHRLVNPAWHTLHRDFLRCRRRLLPARSQARGAAVELSGGDAGYPAEWT